MQCTARRCGTGPAEQVMPPLRVGAVHLNGPVAMEMQQCYVEVRVKGAGHMWLGLAGAVVHG
jgi:hypothetical protein